MKIFFNFSLKVRPGDMIQLADGVYTGKFTTDRSGTKNKKIILRGSKNALITNPGEDGLVLQGCSHWILDGIILIYFIQLR